MTKVLIFFLILGFFSFGCISAGCPSTCDDNNPCTTDACGSDTGHKCARVPLDGEVTGCNGDIDECHSKTCQSGSCTQKTKQMCSFSVSCEEFSIISPSYEFYKSMNEVPSFTCSITNNGDQFSHVLATVELEGYSTKFEKNVGINPGETVDVEVFLSFNEDFYDLPEATSGMLKTKFTSSSHIIHSDSKTIQIEKSSVFSPELGDEELIAMWVTYNDPCIEEIISEAKRFAPENQFLAYQGDDETMYAELTAVFYALYYQDMDYVSSTFTSTNINEAVYKAVGQN